MNESEVNPSNSLKNSKLKTDMRINEISSLLKENASLLSVRGHNPLEDKDREHLRLDG